MMVPKFRAWDETQHKMLQVDYIEFIDGKAYWVEASPADGNVQGGNDGPVGGNSQLKLEQYTGLKDANGKEIYVGDIVEATIEGCIQDDKYLVKNMWDPHVWTEESDGYYAVSKMEVKGNVHENPELLESQHDRN
ncbi:YopX family protein [Levilactobacillus wangkuiensis]|uniref:YopX family protein n=1 Tax=Levilactobacillus wangkuiensis TaxID=2799566 RepID=UPI001CEC968C|nr:YopX family protein [Levilactobacillus wangkuiensis]